MADKKDPVVPNNDQPDAKAPVIDPKDDKGAPANPSQPDPNVSKIIADRDRNFEKAKTAEEKIADLEARQDYLEAEKEKNTYISDVVKENKFTDAEREILAEATSAEQVDKLAKQLNTYRDNAKTEALEELQNVGADTPRLDPDTAKARLEELKGSGNIEEMLNIKRQL